ncbi:tape measure protein, partial [Bifidobacterium olomucense]|nr:phage tail length tape-measure protein [Bifidobacterium sp. DSM 109959]
MAYQLAQAYVQIVPSMKGVGKAIEAAFAGPAKSTGDKAGQTAGAGFSKGFGAKIGVISGIASSVASKVIGVFQGLSGQIMEASDSTQKFAQTLQFAGVGTNEVKRLTASTQEYANKTVYGIDDIRNTTAQLAANGVPNYAKLAEAAGNLNAVAGGNANTFKSVAMMLTQTAGAGKLTTENWNQLADAIPGASGKLQEAMLKNGAYTGNFRDAMANGEITADEFNQALMQLGMTDVAKEAAESTATFEGAFGNLEATIVDGSAQIVNTVKPYLTGFVTDLGNGIGTALQWVNDFMGALMKSQGVQTFANGVKQIATGLGAIIGPIATVVASLFGFSTGTNGAATSASNLSGILSAIGTVLQTVGTFIQQNAQWIQPLAVAVMAAYTAFNLWNGAMALWQTATKIATVVQTAFNAVMAANPIMLAVAAIAALTAGLVWFFTQTEVGRQAWQAFMDWLAPIWQSIQAAWSAAWTAISSFIQSNMTTIQAIWDTVWGAISAYFTYVWNG